MIYNPFKNINGCFSCTRINRLSTNNIKTLTPKPITTQEQEYLEIHKSDEIAHIGHRLRRKTRDLLNILIDSNIISLLSSALTEYEIINLKCIKSMIKEYLDCKDNVKWKLSHLISHVRRDTLTFPGPVWH